MPVRRRDFAWATLAAAPPLGAQAAQFPSPMVEFTRRHDRLTESWPDGERYSLTLGELFVPERLRNRERLPLALHFHGPAWVSQQAAARAGRCALLSVHLGAGSAVYARPFHDPRRFAGLVAEAERVSGRRFPELALVAWSAGYGAVREILGCWEHWARVGRVLAADAIHAGYRSGRPGPLQSELVAEDLTVFSRYAREAADERKHMLVTHSEVFPGTFASTTETADYLLSGLGVRRAPVLKWGPLGMQQLSAVKVGQFRVLGFAGNSAPDHVDHLHALPWMLRLLFRG